MSKKRKTSRAKLTAVLSTMVLLGVFAAFTPTTWARYSGGTGEPNDPYRIAIAEDLNDIGNHEDDWDKHFVLVNDVNLAQYTGTQFNIIGRYINWYDPNNKPFTGVFDGNEHKVWSFTWDSNGIDGIGLFGYVKYPSQIKNLGMENVDVNTVSGNYISGLCGQNEGTISDCYSTGNVIGGFGSFYLGGLCGRNAGIISDSYATGSVTGGDNSAYVGGLCGLNYYGMISNCYATGAVIAGDNSYGGGLCGMNLGGTIRGCYATGNVTFGENSFRLGGLCGLNYKYGTISDCYATGNVTGGDNSGYLGGLCGQNLGGTISRCYATGNVAVGENSLSLGGLCGLNYEYGTISDCYATGNVTDGDNSGYLGGLVGQNGFWSEGRTPIPEPGYISYSYSTGNVQGNRVIGGLVGYNFCGGIETSFWDVQTSGEPNMCGYQNEPYATGCDPNCGKTTAQMKTKSTFTDAGWDFIETWGIGEHQTYPYLLTGPAGDFNYDKEVNFIDLAILAEHWLESITP